MNCGVMGSRNSVAAGSPSVNDIEQKSARDAQALVDREAAVEVRIVDQPLPAHRRARLLEVRSHHDEQISLEPRGRLDQALGVLEGSGRIVNRAGPHDDEKPVVPAFEDLSAVLRALSMVAASASSRGISSIKMRWREEGPQVFDAQVVGAGEHGSLVLFFEMPGFAKAAQSITKGRSSRPDSPARGYLQLAGTVSASRRVPSVVKNSYVMSAGVAVTSIAP